MKMILTTLTVVSSLMLGPGKAAAEPASATPENEYAIQQAVTQLLSPLEVTSEMVERIEFCRYRINRPTIEYQRTYDFTKLDNVFAFAGLTGNLSTARKADINISAGNSYSARDFTCIVGGSGGSEPRDCQDSFVIREASARQFMVSHSAAAEIVRLCNPGASYKVCPGGQYLGFRCVE